MDHTIIDAKAFGPNDLARYGPTAARPVSTEPIRLKTRTIDAHAHVFLPKAAEYMAPHFDLLKAPLLRHATELSKSINQAQNRDRLFALTSVADRMKVLDAQGIDIQVIGPNPPQSYYGADPKHTKVAATIVNDGIAEMVAERPDRLVGIGTVPMNDPAAAVEEMVRCMRDLNFKGVQVLGNVNGREISSPEFEPFWAKASELGAVVMIHPYGFSSGERFSEYYLSNVIGIPLDTTVALHYMIFDGVLERYPELKIFSVHGGGYMAAYSGRIDHAWGARKDAHGSLSKLPSSYLKQVYFDGLVFTPHQLEYLVKVYGPDHVMMGTDYPFDMAEFYPVEHLQSAGLSGDDLAKVAGGTAAKLFGID